MSEKKRQKKDGERKDKQNEAMHDAVNDRKQRSASQDARDAANRTDTGHGATDNARDEGGAEDRP